MADIPAWAPFTAYHKDAPASFVSFGDRDWVCVVDHTSGASFDLAKWLPAATQSGLAPLTADEKIVYVQGDKGDPGAKGDKGDQGDEGDPGPKGDAGQPGVPDPALIDSRVQYAFGLTQTVTGAYTFNDFTSANAKVTGGRIDGTPIGQNTRANGAFLSLLAASLTLTGAFATTGGISAQGTGQFNRLVASDPNNTSSPNSWVLASGGVNPSIGVNNTQGATDQKCWDHYAANDGTLHFRAVSDNGAAAPDWLTVSRVNFTPQAANFAVPLYATRIDNTPIGLVTPANAKFNTATFVNAPTINTGPLHISPATSAATPGTLNKVDVFNGVYGFGVSSASLDYLADAGAAHTFYVGGTTIGRIQATGLDGMPIGQAIQAPGSFTNLTAANALTSLGTTSLQGLTVAGTSSMAAVNASSLSVTNNASAGAYTATQTGAQFISKGYNLWSDSNSFYVLLTGTQTPTTAITGQRPLTIDLTSGLVTMSAGLNVNGGNVNAVGTVAAAQHTGTSVNGGTGSAFLAQGSSAAAHGFNVTGGAADAKIWDIYATNGNQLLFSALNDAQSSRDTWMYATRSGGTVSGIYFQKNTSFAAQVSMTAANASIEIGSLSAANTPFIDFHSSGNNIDYDVRMLASGGNGAIGQGTLNISAAGGVIASNSFQAPQMVGSNAGTGTGSGLLANSTTPAMALYKNNGPTDAKTWDFVVFGDSSLHIRALNDTGSVGNDALYFSRSAGVPLNAVFGCGVNGPTFSTSGAGNGFYYYERNGGGAYGALYRINGLTSFYDSVYGASTLTIDTAGNIVFANGATATSYLKAPTMPTSDSSTNVATTSFVKALAASLTQYAHAPVRQTVSSGPMDSGGNPTFLPSTSASLSLTSQNLTSAAPLTVTAANGWNPSGPVNRFGSAVSNLTWSGLVASTTNYLSVTVNSDGSLTPISSTTPPAYSPNGVASTANNALSFNYSSMVGAVGNGSAAVQSYTVAVGECVTSASGVTSSAAYAYNGVYESPWLNTSPAGSSNQTYTSNLGTVEAIGNLVCECVTQGTFGYNTGDRAVAYTYDGVNNSFTPLAITLGRNTVNWQTGQTGVLYVRNRSTSASATIGSGATTFRYKVQVYRNF